MKMHEEYELSTTMGTYARPEIVTNPDDAAMKSCYRPSNAHIMSLRHMHSTRLNAITPLIVPFP